MLHSWSVILREGQRLRVFINSILKKLGLNIHEVMGRLVKSPNSFVASLY